MSKVSVRDIFSNKMLVLFLLGLSGGIPLALVGSTLKVWLAREQVDISTIGYFSWVGLAYSLKFVWSPLLDRFSFFGFGRRRSWLLISQVGIMAGLFVMGTIDPKLSLMELAIFAIIVAFFGATQDIASDAYRREICTDKELGIGSSVGIYGYRIGMLVSGGLGIGLVGSELLNLSWGQLYWVMAVTMAVGLVTTLFAAEPALDPSERPLTLLSAVVDPFREFLTRDGAFFVLFFVFLFKLGDALSGAMLTPFYVQMGYSNADIGLIAKIFGLTSSLVGLFIGGVLIMRMGIFRSLWVFGILQALSTASFAIITFTGPEKWALAFAVVFEDISSGMGNAAFVAFIASVCNRRYTATQYALLSSIATLGRTFFSGFTGDMEKALGWSGFFYTCALIAIPGLVMLFAMRKYQFTDPAGTGGPAT